MKGKNTGFMSNDVRAALQLLVAYKSIHMAYIYLVRVDFLFYLW